MLPFDTGPVYLRVPKCVITLPKDVAKPFAGTTMPEELNLN